MDHQQTVIETSATDFLHSDVIFSGIKSNFFSKNFKGGTMRVIFGGVEIDLSDADMEHGATLCVNQFFGGIKLWIPADWKLKIELTNFFAGVQDKRSSQRLGNRESNKCLTLTGYSIFGGIALASRQ